MRTTGAVCRLCRREGEKLYLKGEKCFTPKCPIEKRKYTPGQHRKTYEQIQRRLSNFGQAMRAKQKVKRIAGVGEAQFRRVYAEAGRRPGHAGLNVLTMLEMRLDRVVQRMGFATSPAFARQLVRHGHVRLNGRRASVPSMTVKAGDGISLSERMKENLFVKQSLDAAVKRGLPSWLSVDPAAAAGKVLREPTREELSFAPGSPPVEQLIVEYYSRR